MGNTQLDRSTCNLVKVEFMTQKQKKYKDEAINEWKRKEKALEESEDDFSIVPNLEELYDVSFRQEVYIPKNMKEIDVGYVMQYIDEIDEQLHGNEECAYPKLAKFVKTEVKSYFLLLDGKEVTDRATKIDMGRCVIETPVFEFIYKKRPFLDYLAKKTVYIAKNWKKMLFKKVIKFFGIAPLLEAYQSIQKGDKTGILSLICSKQSFQLLSKYFLGPDMAMGGAKILIKLFFPFAAPFLFLINKG